MSLWTYAVAAGVATAALVDTLKVLLPIRTLRAWHKIWFGLWISCALSAGFLYWGSWQQALVIWALSWGFSRIVHSVTSFLQTVKDKQRSEIMRRIRR